MSVLGFVESVQTHLVAVWADGYAFGRDLDVGVRCFVLFAPVVQVDKGFDILMIKQEVDVLGIMSGVEKQAAVSGTKANRIDYLPQGSCTCGNR